MEVHPILLQSQIQQHRPQHQVLAKNGTNAPPATVQGIARCVMALASLWQRMVNVMHVTELEMENVQDVTAKVVGISNKNKDDEKKRYRIINKEGLFQKCSKGSLTHDRACCFWFDFPIFLQQRMQ